MDSGGLAVRNAVSLTNFTNAARLHPLKNEKKLSGAKPSPGQIEHWIDKTVAKRWGVHAAARMYHIAKTGYDGALVSPFATEAKLHEHKVRFTKKGRGSFAPVRNAYHISQVLNWLASQQGTIENQLNWMIDIPYLIRALLKEEKPVTLSMSSSVQSSDLDKEDFEVQEMLPSLNNRQHVKA